jgi:hypothetical protein
MKYYPQQSLENLTRPTQLSFFNRQSGSPAMVQPKLTVGASNDRHEQEADKTADMVMRKPENSVKNGIYTEGSYFTPTITPIIQRACAHCEKEKEQPAQRKETDASKGGFTAPDSVSRTISRGGSALDSNAKTFMESRFNRSFDNVQVHTDSEAAASARDISARAYTSGNHIVFGDGQYQPNTEGGRHLLAHELTHTVQQGNIIQRDNKVIVQDEDVKSLQKNISDKEWMTAYYLLNRQWMVFMLKKLDALTEPEISLLISNADVAMNAPGSMLGEGGKNRILSALLAVKSVKKGDMPDTDIEIAKEKGLSIKFDQRVAIIAYLSRSKSKAAKKLALILNKPFLGYTASAYDFSDRFLKHSDKLGFDIESNTKSLPQTSWDKDDPDPQTQPDTAAATSSFEKSDMVFFSGHQYAQYKRPGLFTNEASNSCFSIGAISKKINKVKLVVSTSCATICKDTAKIFTSIFPNALVLGYKYSAPSNGGTVSTAFVNSLVSKGAIDLTSSSGIDAVKDSWKKVTITNPGKEGQPGMLFNDEVEFYNGKEWQKAKADSAENDCKYH